MISMQKENIVEYFFLKEKVFTPDALEAATGDIMAMAHDFQGFILTKDDVMSCQNADMVKIIMNIEKKPTEMSTEDFVKYYNSKLEKMRKIIMSRIQKDFVSINKLANDKKEQYIIGMVRSIKKKDEKTCIEIEDKTGSAEVYFDKADADIEDVIAISAIHENGVIKGLKILYPDIPLRQPAKGKGKACFISDIGFSEAPDDEIRKFFQELSQKHLNFVFIMDSMQNKEQIEKYISEYLPGRKIFVCLSDDDYPTIPVSVANATCLSNPSMIEANGIKILMSYKLSIDALKKRSLGRPKWVLAEDMMALDEIPDVVHCGHSKEYSVTNYKSTTIVNSGTLLSKFEPVIIDLETREVLKW